MAKNFPVKGNIPAVVTPFGKNGELRIDDFAAIVKWHLARGVDGLCLAGDNGEAWNLTLEERTLIAETAVKIAAKRVPVVMGASSTTAKQTIVYAENAAKAGVDAIMVGPQSYVMKATTKELVTRMETIHKAVPLPIVLYNSPRRTNISLTIDSMRAITEAVNIIAIKEASRDFFYITHVIQNFKDKLAVLVGAAPYIIPGVQLGAAGFISSGPELLGDRAQKIMPSVKKPLDDEMKEIQYAFTRIYELLMALGTWPAGLKAAHILIGQPAGIPREPVLPLDDAGVASLASLLAELRREPIGATRAAAE